MPVDWQSLFALSPEERGKVKQQFGKAARREAWIGKMRRVYGPGPEDRRCRDCAHFYFKQFAKDYPKCSLAGVSGGPATDWRATQATCGKFEASPAKEQP